MLIKLDGRWVNPELVESITDAPAYWPNGDVQDRAVVMMRSGDTFHINYKTADATAEHINDILNNPFGVLNVD